MLAWGKALEFVDPALTALKIGTATGMNLIAHKECGDDEGCVATFEVAGW